MVSVGDGEDTQILDDFDPPRADAPGEMLNGETQALDDDDDSAAAAAVDWGKTQVLDDETEEMTVALSDGDDEGLSDDGATPTPPLPSVAEEEKGIPLATVDSDASTDDEGSARSVRRSFGAVRAASVRSSGLAAARSMTPKRDSQSQSTPINGESNKNDASAKDGQPVGDATELNKQLNGAKHPGGTKSSEVDVDHETGKSNRFSSNGSSEETKRTMNPRVRRLFNEVIAGKEELAMKTDDMDGKLDSSCVPVSDCAFAGLSYVTSQEPGELSQANALDIVDKFISVNDEGLSQKTDTGSTDMVKSPPTSNAKGIQSLVKSLDKKSPVLKRGIYEWVDSFEDEGGGDFFSKRKDTFFEKGGLRKLHSHPPKARHVRSAIARGSNGNGGEKEAANSHNHMKTSLIHSDSRLELRSSKPSERVLICEKKTKKNLFKDMDEQSNVKSLEKELEVNCVDGDIDGTYNVGPDTQMAAEAMEALGLGSPFQFREDAQAVSEHVPENSTKCAVMNNTFSISASPRKRTFSNSVFEGVTTRSKQRKNLRSKGGKESLSLSTNHSSSVKVKKNSEVAAERTKVKEKECKQEGNLCNSSVNGNIYAGPLKSEKARGMLDQSSTEVVGKYHKSAMSKGQHPSSKKFMQGEFHVLGTPIAYRTRHSRKMKLKETEAVSTDKDMNGVRDGECPVITEREAKLLTDSSRTMKSKRKASNGGDQIAISVSSIMSHTELQNVEGSSAKELKSRSLLEDVCCHPKRQRCQIASRNHEIDSNMKNPSVTVANMLAITEGPSIQQNDTIFKSIPEILDTAKRKKRSVSRKMPLQTEGMPLITRSVLTESTARRSSSYEPFVEKDLKLVSDEPILHEAGFADAGISSTTCMEDRECYRQVAVLKQGEDSPYHAKDADKQNMSPKVDLQQPSLAHKTPPNMVHSVSPICMAENPLESNNKGLSRLAVVRELIRLGASEAPPSRISKDLRRRKDMASLRVLFSHHLDEDVIKQQKKILGRLGASTASSMSDATHFVTDKFVRTRNMLEAIALGKPVVTHMWLDSCGQVSCFIDEKNYILRDFKKEKEIGFSMPVSLARASECPLLQGRRVFITPNVNPDREVISSLVKAAQGVAMERIGRFARKDNVVPDDLLIISCEEDYSICKPLLEKGGEVFSSELLLNGIVIQKLEYERHRIFVDRVKRTRSTIWLRRDDGVQFLPVTKCT